MASPNPIVFFDITLAGEPLGRVKMELFADVTPRTAEYIHFPACIFNIQLTITHQKLPPILHRRVEELANEASRLQRLQIPPRDPEVYDSRR